MQPEGRQNGTGLWSEQVCHLTSSPSRQQHCKVAVVAHWVFLIPFTVPARRSSEDQTPPASRWLAGARCPHDFCGTSQAVGREQREGGREFPGHLFAPVTYYLPQLEQRPCPAPPPGHHPAFNPNVCLAKTGTSQSQESASWAVLREAAVGS